jgi:hypothetical protein
MLHTLWLHEVVKPSGLRHGGERLDSVPNGALLDFTRLLPAHG